MTGLLVVLGRRSGNGRFESMRTFLLELHQGDAQRSLVRRLRDGEPVPGFGSRLYPQGDPRAKALLAHCVQIFHDDPRLQQVVAAQAIMLDATGLHPDFAFVSLLVGELLGLSADASFFLIGRTVGWVAHAMEQYAAGEFQHLEGRYLGPLPISEGT